MDSGLLPLPRPRQPMANSHRQKLNASSLKQKHHEGITNSTFTHVDIKMEYLAVTTSRFLLCRSSQSGSCSHLPDSAGMIPI
jgi:hypothetical protein